MTAWSNETHLATTWSVGKCQAAWAFRGARAFLPSFRFRVVEGKGPLGLGLLSLVANRVSADVQESDSKFSDITETCSL